jgi:RNA polymerase sigma-70 factor (ECF subfamily)
MVSVLERSAPVLADEAAPPPWLDDVRLARGGDRRAFARLHGAFKGMVHGIVVSRVSWAESQDLVQDVFLSALAKLSSLEDDQALGAWLAQLARHRASHHVRDRKEHEPLDEALPASPREASAGHDAKKVLAALRTLPEAYRETLAMRLIEGMTGPEIAQATGLTPGSVRVNLHRGMQALKEKLGLSEKGASDE